MGGVISVPGIFSSILNKNTTGICSWFEPFSKRESLGGHRRRAKSRHLTKSYLEAIVNEVDHLGSFFSSRIEL
jgi:hypothetical protein